jgi:hypothetical protein
MGAVKRYIGRQELWTNQAGCMGKLRMNNVAAQVIVCLGSTRARLVETPELLKVEWIQTRSGDTLTTSYGAIRG